METGRPPSAVLTNFFGTRFGCICSLTWSDQHNAPDSAIWFIDAGARGFEAGFRKRPTLPAAIWRYNTFAGDLRMMSDDVTSPWGIAISPDGETVYVTGSNPVRDEAGVAQKNMCVAPSPPLVWFLTS